MKPLIWVHGDCLSPQGPPFRTYPQAPALWVWDEAAIERYQLTLKRIVFLYECLLELPVIIKRGEPASVIVDHAQALGASFICTADSPSPGFNRIVTVLEANGLPVEVLPEDPFIPAEVSPDLKRFSRYWTQAEPFAMVPTHQRSKG